jgi:hypothetical protein
MSNNHTADEHWILANEAASIGQLYLACHYLSQAFGQYAMAGDARIAQVHARWTELHRDLVAQGGVPDLPNAAPAESNLHEEAEAAVNSGDLPRGIALYERIVAASPENELANERLVELKAANARANELAPPTPAPTPAPQAVAPAPAPAPEPTADIIELDTEMDFSAEPISATPTGGGAAAKVAKLEMLLQRIASRRKAG